MNPFRSLFLPAFALLALLLLPLPAQAAAAAGQPAPDFSALSTTGVQIKLADLKGRYVILEWTNNMCPFVRKHYDSGNMQALQKKYVGKGVTWISVISSAEGKQGFVTDAEEAKIVKKEGSAATYIIRDTDGSLGRLYGAKTTPHMFVIDKEGKVAYAGAIDSIASTEITDVAQAENYIDKAFGELETGKPVSVASTRSYGCSIKY
jgi:peroxiredoxin